MVSIYTETTESASTEAGGAWVRRAEHTCVVVLDFGSALQTAVLVQNVLVCLMVAVVSHLVPAVEQQRLFFWRCFCLVAMDCMSHILLVTTIWTWYIKGNKIKKIKFFTLQPFNTNWEPLFNACKPANCDMFLCQMGQRWRTAGRSQRKYVCYHGRSLLLHWARVLSSLQRCGKHQRQHPGGCALWVESKHSRATREELWWW